MNHFECPHIEGTQEAQWRRAEAARRLRDRALEKFRQRRFSELTPEEYGWIASTLNDVSPDA